MRKKICNLNKKNIKKLMGVKTKENTRLIVKIGRSE